MEEVDCNEIAQSVARLIRPRTVEHGLTMKIDLPDRPVVLMSSALIPSKPSLLHSRKKYGAGRWVSSFVGG